MTINAGSQFSIAGMQKYSWWLWLSLYSVTSLNPLISSRSSLCGFLGVFHVGDRVVYE